METRLFSFLALAAVLSLNSCGNAETRTDSTAGEAVSDIDKATDEGAVEVDAKVIDNDAGPTVTAAADSVLGPDAAPATRP